MQGSSGNWKRKEQRGPARVVRRVVVSVLAVIGALVVLGVVLIAVQNHGGKKGLASSLGLGKSRTVPLHHRGSVGQGWMLKVTSVKLHAFQRLGGAAKKTAGGGQDAMVNLSVGYTGQGYGHLRSLLGRLYVSGSNQSQEYGADGGNLNCAARPGVGSPTPLNEKGTLVFKGHVARGHLCFLFPHVEAKALALYVDAPGCNTAGPNSDNCDNRTQFALR
jgi:hypothetical protein